MLLHFTSETLVLVTLSSRFVLDEGAENAFFVPETEAHDDGKVFVDGFIISTDIIFCFLGTSFALELIVDAECRILKESVQSPTVFIFSCFEFLS